MTRLLTALIFPTLLDTAEFVSIVLTIGYSVFFQDKIDTTDLKWLEQTMVTMLMRRMMADRVSRFRKFPTSAARSCCPRQIPRHLYFLNT